MRRIQTWNFMCNVWNECLCLFPLKTSRVWFTLALRELYLSLRRIRKHGQPVISQQRAVETFPKTSKAETALQRIRKMSPISSVILAPEVDGLVQCLDASGSRAEKRCQPPEREKEHVLIKENGSGRNFRHSQQHRLEWAGESPTTEASVSNSGKLMRSVRLSLCKYYLQRSFYCIDFSYRTQK